MPFKSNKGAQKDVNLPVKDPKATNRLSVNSSHKFLVNDAIKGSNLKDWLKSTMLIIDHDYPTIYEEVISGVELTLNEAIVQLYHQYPQEKEEDVDEIVVPVSEVARLADLAPPERLAAELEILSIFRAAAESKNAILVMQNEVYQEMIKSESKKLVKIHSTRRACAAHIMQLMSPASQVAVRNHKDFDASKEGYNSPYSILEIARKTHMVFDGDNAHQRLAEDKLLKSLRQGSNELQLYFENYQWQVERCEAVGQAVDDEVRNLLFIESLNPILFSELQANWRNPLLRASLPKDWSRLKTIVTESYMATISNKPALAHMSSPSAGKNSVALSTSSLTASGVTCQLCDAKGHSAKTCKSIVCQACKNKGHTADTCGRALELAPAAVEKFQAWRKDNPKKPYKNDKKGTANHVAVICACHEKREAMITSCQPDDVIDLIYDTASDATTVNRRDLLVGAEKTNVVLEGFVPGSTTKASWKGGLNRDFPPAVFVDTKYSLLSDEAVSESFDKEFIGKNKNGIALTNFASGNRYEFIRDRSIWPDGMMHCVMPVSIFRAMNTSLYQPPTVPEPPILSAAVEETVKTAENLHWKLDHPSDEALCRTIAANPGAFACKCEDVKLMRKVKGPCPSCAQGKMVSHPQLPSTKSKDYEVGEAAAGDVMFLENAKGGTDPALLMVDLTSRCMLGYVVEGRTTFHIKGAFDKVMSAYQEHGHKLRVLKFDRESAVVSLCDHLRGSGITPKLNAAGQKVGEAEVSIRIIKDRMRSTYYGIRQKYNYLLPKLFFKDLFIDSIKTQNLIVRHDESKCPRELFTGSKLDPLRDLRADFGEIVLCLRPKEGACRGMEPKADWAIILDRSINGTGVIKVYNIEAKSYAHRLKFIRAVVPGSILSLIAKVDFVSGVAFEEGPSPRDLVYVGPRAVVVEDNVSSDVVELPALASTFVEDEVVSEEVAQLDALGVSFSDDVAPAAENQIPAVPSHPYNLRQRQKAYATRSIIKGFKKAQVLRPEAAQAAMKVELEQVLKKKVFHGVHYHDVPKQERKLILNSMENVTEKFLPSGEFVKNKARLLARGDQQRDDYVGETSSPVARVETIFMLACVAIRREYIVFSIDFVGAYLNTPRPESVKHKYMFLNKEVSELLCSIDDTWLQYLQKDGRILVMMDKLLYGYKEAGFYWHQLLMGMFLNDGFVKCHGDPCLVRKFNGKGEIFVTINTDDCFVAVSSIELKEELVKLCRDTFEEISLQEGDIIPHLGMTLSFNREEKSVEVEQRGHVAQLLAKRNILKACPYPSSLSEFSNPVATTSENSIEKGKYLSLIMDIMYIAKRTYPELLPLSSFLATRSNDANTYDWEVAISLLEYVNYDYESHKMIFRPTSLDVVGCSDASYACHDDGKSRTGGCIGFPGAFFIFISCKQSIVTKSSTEAELVAINEVVDHLVWLTALLRELEVIAVHAPVLFQDNRSAIILSESGRGSFRRSKHIDVRFFYVYDLVKDGKLTLQWLGTKDLPADLLTKPKRGLSFDHLLYLMIGWVRQGCENKKEGI